MEEAHQPHEHLATDRDCNKQGTTTIPTDFLSYSQIIPDREANKENRQDMNNDSPEENVAVSENVNGTETEEADNTPVIDIVINNVVCTFNLRCHINLKRLAMQGANVEYRRAHGICNMKLRRPKVTANITSSGKVTVTGSTSEAEAKMAARRVARRLQKFGFLNVRFFSFRIVNVLGTCSLPFGIQLSNFSNEHRQQASYEPELHPGVTYRIKDPKATMKIFSTGSITITAPCVNNVGLAVEHIYPLVSLFQKEKRTDPNKTLKALKNKPRAHHHGNFNGFHDDIEDEEELDDDEDEVYGSELEDDEFDSDVSHD